MWSKLGRQTRLLIVLCCVALLVLGAVVAAGFLIPYSEAKNTMDPEGQLVVLTQEDGTLKLHWTEGSNATTYDVQVLAVDGQELYSCTTSQCHAYLPQLPEDQTLTVRVTSLREYDGKVRKGSESLEATITQPSPQIRNLNWQADDRYDTVDVAFDMSAGDLCRVHLAIDGAAPVLVEEVKDGKLQLRFGADDRFPVPEHGQQYEVTFQLERKTGNVIYRGAVESFTLIREDFLGRTLSVEQSYNGDNSYTFTWNETKGEYYDVRLSENGGKTWETKAYIPADKERSFTMPALKAFTDCSVSIVAVGGQTMPDSEFAAVADPIEIRTAEKLLYSTIWPQIDQPVYSEPEAAEELELGTAPAGSAWCVLGQEGRYFKIRYDGQDAYIDSEMCMINLPEYIGNLCQYDITNSYSAIYLVHEYGIDNVSGTVIEGYEDVRVGENAYLVPLVYPAAQKLIKAGLDAKAKGYTIKIYDSFRPQDATDSIYERTKVILGNPVPDHTFNGKPADNLSWIGWDPDNGGWMDPVPIFGELTYRRLMTNNGSYSLSSFLAPGISRHNYGLAMDLTLVDSSGVEVPMQTSMHDLSWYSAVAINNANANLLGEIMVGAGFSGIASEWWHFQDNDAYFRNPYRPLRTGVSWECWVADSHGWRYRLPDGSFYANCTETIDEESYSFDENGYLVK